MMTMTCRAGRRGTTRRYMADDVIKQAATDDDDAYNEALQTNTRLMVSPYSGASLNYAPRHHYQHRYPHHQHQLLQQFGVQTTPGADKRWADVTTIVSSAAEDDASAAAGYAVSCGADRHLAAAALEDAGVVTCSAVARPPVCAAHMYESPRFQ